MMEAPVSKMKGLTFKCRSPRTHGQCTRTLGTKHRKIAIYKCAYQSVWHFLAIFVGFAFPPLPDLTPAAL